MLKVLLPLVAVNLAMPFPALAADIEKVRQTVVYRDLDLTHPLGVATLKVRLGAALQRACGVPVHRPLYEAMTYRACVADAQAESAPKVREVIGAARARAGLTVPETLAQASPSSFAKY